MGVMMWGVGGWSMEWLGKEVSRSGERMRRGIWLVIVGCGSCMGRRRAVDGIMMKRLKILVGSRLGIGI